MTLVREMLKGRVWEVSAESVGQRRETACERREVATSDFGASCAWHSRRRGRPRPDAVAGSGNRRRDAKGGGAKREADETSTTGLEGRTWCVVGEGTVLAGENNSIIDDHCYRPALKLRSLKSFWRRLGTGWPWSGKELGPPSAVKTDRTAFAGSTVMYSCDGGMICDI